MCGESPFGEAPQSQVRGCPLWCLQGEGEMSLYPRGAFRSLFLMLLPLTDRNVGPMPGPAAGVLFRTAAVPPT